MEATEGEQPPNGLRFVSGKARIVNQVPDAQFWALSQSPTSQGFTPMISNYKYHP